MLRKFCLDTGDDWDANLHWILFAIRKANHEALGVSPFELLYGRPIRGPLKVIKDKWFDSQPSPLIVNQYLINLRKKMQNLRTFAQSQLSQHQDRSIKLWGMKAVPRTFNVGQKVLAFLPASGNPLQKKYNGPYIIKEKINPVNYIIESPDRRMKTQLVHINLIKEYISRTPESESEEIPVVSLCVKEEDSETVTSDNKMEENSLDMEVCTSVNAIQNSDILANLKNHYSWLEISQLKDIQSSLTQYPQIIADNPGCCHLISHDIVLIDSNKPPIRQPPYRLHPAKLAILKQEV